MSGTNSLVDAAAATPDDYASGVVQGQQSPQGALNTSTTDPNPPALSVPDQPALQTPAPNTLAGQPMLSPDELAQKAQEVMANQQKARQVHEQTWADRAAASGYDPSKADNETPDAGPPPDNKHGVLRDFGDRLWAATLQSGASVTGAVSFLENQLNADPEFIKETEDFKDTLQKHVEATYNDLSDAGKQALHASIWGGKDAEGNDVPTPSGNWARYLTGNLADFIPGVVGGTATGAALVAAAPEVLGGVIPAALGKTLATSLGNAAVFSALNAGQTYNMMVDKVRDAKPQELMNSPVYKASIEAGRTDTQARQDLIHTVTAPFVALSGAVGGVTGAGFGAMTAGAMLPAGAPLIVRALVSGMEGGTTMAAQAGGTDVVEQNANIATGTQQNFDPAQTATAAAQGFATGFAIGGPLGLFHGGGKTAETATQQEPTHVDPATKAALDTALTNEATAASPPTPEPEPPTTSVPPAPPPENVDTTPSQSQEGVLQTPQEPPSVAPVPPGASPAENVRSAPTVAGPIPSEGSPPATVGPENTTPAAPAPGTIKSDGEKTAEVQPTEPAAPAMEGPAAGPEAPPANGSAETGGAEPTLDPLTFKQKIAEAQDPDHPRDTVFVPEGVKGVGVGHKGLFVATKAGAGRLYSKDPLKLAAFKAMDAKDVTPEAIEKLEAFGKLPTSEAEPKSETGSAPATPVEPTTNEPPTSVVEPIIKDKEETPAPPPAPQTKGDALKEQLKAKRAAEKAKLKGEAFKRAENVHVDEPTTNEPVLKTEPAPVIEARPEGDLEEAYRELTGETEHEEETERGPALAEETRTVPTEPEKEPTFDEEENSSEETHETQEDEDHTIKGPQASSQDLDIGEKTRAITSTDRKRDAVDALEAVREGLKTVHEAAADFDHVKGGSGGRPARNEYSTFEKFLEHSIKLTDPDKINAKIDELVKLMSNKNNKVPVKELVKHVTELKSKLDERKELEGYLEQLRDPVGDAVRREGMSSNAALRKLEKAKARDDVGSGEPKLTYKNRVIKDLAANKNFIQAMRDAEATGQRYQLSDLLRLAARNQTGSLTNIYNRNLANHLATLSDGLNIPVMTHDEALDRGLLDDYWKSLFNSGRAFGAYNPDENHIILSGKNFSNHDMITTLNHEAIHAFSVKIIRDNPNSPLVRALGEVQQELTRILRNPGLKDFFKNNPSVEYNLKYAQSSPEETLTMMLTDTSLHSVTSVMPASEQLKEGMRKYGVVSKLSDIWSHFKSMMMRALGVESDPNSVFEHSLRPLQALVEQGARELQQEAGLLPGGASPNMLGLLNFSDGTTREKAERLFRSIDLAGITDKAREAYLQATTTDAITKKYSTLSADFGKGLRDLRAASERVNKTTADYIAKNSDRVTDIIKRLQGRDELAALLNDATIAKATLGTNVNPKLNKGVDNIVELESRYRALTPADRDTYHDVVSMFKKQYEVKSAAERTSLINHFLPEATPDQKAAVDDLLAKRSTKEIQKFIDNADDSDIAKMFADKWDRSKAFVVGIADLMKGAKLKGDYFPLRRYGDYVLTYGDSMTAREDDPLARYGVEMFEKHSDAVARKAELEAAGHANVSEVMTKQESPNKIRIDLPFVKRMFSSLEDSSLNAAQIQEARDLLSSVILEHGTTSDVARIARRRGIQGASKDAARTVASEHLNLAYRLGYLLHGDARRDALADMKLARDNLKGPHQQIVANAVVREMEKRVAANGPNTSFMSELARRASNLGFMQSVASPSHMLTSTAESQSLAASLLAPRHGAGAATAALLRAGRDLAPRLLKEGAVASFKAARKGLQAADWNMAQHGIDQLVKNGADADQMARLFKPIQEAGLIDHTQDRDIRDIAKGGSYGKNVASRAWDRFRDLNTIGAHAVDVMNRMAIAKAAFDLELKKTGSEAVAIERAVDVLRDAVPNYGAKARIATEKGVLGRMAAPIMQFKNYGLHMYSVMGNLLHASLRGADPQERKEAAKALAGIFMTHALMAGALTTVGDPLALAGVAYSAFTGNTKPHDFEADLRGFLSDVMGPTFAEIFSRGLPHALGIDVQHRVGLSNLLELPELESLDGKGFIKYLGAIATGASGEDASNMVAGLLSIFHGDLQKGFEGLVPRVLRDPLKAYRIANEGITGPRGKPGLSPDDIGPGAIAAQAVGFQPAVVSEYREGRAAVAQAKAETEVEHQRLIQAWVAATDAGARAEAMSAIQQYNADNPGNEIQMPSLFSALRTSRLNQAAQPGSFGLRLSPAQAKAMAQAGRFANVN